MTIFAQNVAKIQRQHNLTDRELATFLNLSPNTVRRILSRRRVGNAGYTPTYRTVRTVADKVKLSTDEVFKYHIEFIAI
jgi:transcriptional regulator with XRE-family HTH domain